MQSGLCVDAVQAEEKLKGEEESKDGLNNPREEDGDDLDYERKVTPKFPQYTSSFNVMQGESFNLCESGMKFADDRAN